MSPCTIKLGAPDMLLLLTAALAAQTFTLEGRVDLPIPSTVTIYGATSSFQDSADLLPRGRFRFRNLPQGSYTLSVSAGATGQARRTVVLSPETTKNGLLSVLVSEDDFRSTPDSSLTIPLRLLRLPSEARKLNSQALRCLERRDSACAEQRLLRAVDIAPDYAEALNLLGTIAYHRQDYPLAAERFRLSLQADPAFYPPLVNLGGVLLNLGQPDDARQFNLKAVDRNPSDALAHGQLGIAYLMLNDLPRAETSLLECKRLDPAHFSYPQLHLAQLYARQLFYSLAADQLDEFLRLHPSHPSAAQLRADSARLKSLQPSPTP